MNSSEQLIEKIMPQHVAIIMDGNGRWAKKKGKLRTFGHKSGVKAVILYPHLTLPTNRKC